ncbi:hypothetical protein WJX72_005031 [[Myrmecia] bisecta]|uniref:HMA domain-containing protein n=1 Tax=[Myrmecia] bisecta TaxID=41462 RepID=A0AAW1PTQ0_9CHLO
MPEVALKVAMSCGGCEAAVRRVLGKLEGVESVNVDMQQQKVVVTGTASPEAVLQTVAKTGKCTGGNSPIFNTILVPLVSYGVQQVALVC